jgi:hypothetical protein
MEYNKRELDEALFALNRCLHPQVANPSNLEQKLIQARDNVWFVITSLDPTRKD